MVVIRLARGGSKKSPFYNVVVADKRCARDGRFIERIGYFNPMARGQAIRLVLEKERVQYWLDQGAQASDRVATLVREFQVNAEKEVKPTPTKAAQRQAQADEAAKSSKKAKQEATTSESPVAGEEEAK